MYTLIAPYITHVAMSNVLQVVLIVLAFIQIGFILMLLASHNSYKRKVKEKDTTNSNLKEDMVCLQSTLAESNNDKNSLVRQVDLLNRNCAEAFAELNLLKSKLESDTDYKNAVYTTLVNFYQTTHSLLWRGGLGTIVNDLLGCSFLTQASDETQLAVKNMYEIKARYVALDSELQILLTGVPEHLDRLTRGLLQSDELVEVSVVVPVTEVNKLYLYTFALRQEYEDNKPIFLEEAP